MATLTKKQVLIAGAPQKRSPAGSPVQVCSRGEDLSGDVALELLLLAGMQKLENENKALLHQILRAHTRRTKAKNERGVGLANHFIAQTAVTPTLNILVFAGDLSSEDRSRSHSSEALQSLLEPFEGTTMHDLSAENLVVRMAETRCPALGVTRGL